MNFKTHKKYFGPILCFMGLIMVMLVTMIQSDQDTEAPKLGEAFRITAAQKLSENLLQQFLPLSSFVQYKDWSKAGQFTKYPIEQIMPFYQFASNDTEEVQQEKDQITIEMILQAEAEEGQPDRNKDVQEAEDKITNIADNRIEEISDNQAVQLEESQTDLTTLMMEENQIAESSPTTLFSPHEKQMEVDMASLANYETLVKTFYTISDNTMIGSDQLNIENLESRDMRISKEDPGPQILIYHTHSQEMFADSLPGDSSTSIVGVGQHLTDLLTQQYGYQVLHHTGEYDRETRDDAYSRSLPAIEKVLEENPSIQVIIDLHRDGVAEGTHLVTDLDGRPTARFMFFNGLSRTRKTGNISYLYNKNLEGNLAFSFQMQKAAVEYYPGLTRKIYLQGYRYNMHLREKSLLIELGAQTNTVEEAMNACDPLAHILDLVLSKEE